MVKYQKVSKYYDHNCRSNLKLHNSIISKLVKKVITNLDPPKTSGPNFILVVVLKNCEPERLYILAELFNMSQKESCFPDCWKVLSVVPVFKNVGGKTCYFRSSRLTADLLTVVSDRIARAFNRSEATRAVALDISKVFDKVWHTDLLQKFKSYGISGHIFGLILFFLRQLSTGSGWEVSSRISSQCQSS